MDLLEDLKMSVLNFNFIMIYIIHKTLSLYKNNRNYLTYNRLLFLFFRLTFFTTYNDGNFKS